MNIDGDGERESPDDGKGIKDGRLGENKSLFALNELNVHAANEVEKVEALIGLQVPSTLQVQPLPQGKVVRWERFLNVESIQVLLVENDDCTRHVVAALLRNCNYEVLVAANGLHAWKILEDLNNRIDIVLTEVVMPFLPGIPLLSKIMSHKTRKNIPVIMMSSHDSMGLVFKCLSKGAVDFLVKPIRKNELKNLWQHVWRRCRSSSGSGSESGTQTQKSVKSKGCEKSGNSGSDDEEKDSSNGSDYGSGTQSSWTKQAVEVDSSPAISPIDQVADSTCGQVIYSNADNPGYETGHISLPKEGHELKPDNTAEVKGLETNVSRNVESKDKNPVETPVTVIASKLKSFSEFNCSMILNQTDMEQNYPTADCQLRKKGGDDETLDPSIDIIESDSTKEVANILDNNNKGPNIELSLKRLRQVEDTGRSNHDDRYVLHRSQQSAFSRYGKERYITSPNISKAPNGVTCSSSMVDNNSAEIVKQESIHGIQAHSTDHLVYPSQNGISNILDMGSTSNEHIIAHPSLMKDKSDETSTINGLHQSAFRTVKNHLRCTQIQPSSYSQHRGSKIEFESISGNDHVSNGQIGINTESDVGQDGKNGTGSGSCSGNRVDEDKVARRLAALIKFRQKKKDRCFTKKVRYINRKKLAEQRPRVRGQFVKQNGTDSSNRTFDE